MFRFVFGSVAGLACLTATPAFAQTAEADPAAEAAVPAPAADGLDPEKIICRKAPPPTGTRIRGRNRQHLCMTRADWDLMEAEAQAEARANNDPTRNREFLGGESTSSPSRSR